MKTLYIILSLVSVTAFAKPLPWSKDAIAQIRAAKTIKDLVCEPTSSVAGSELCDLYRPYHAEKTGFKVQEFNDGSLVFSKGSMSAKVMRTERESEFLVN